MKNKEKGFIKFMLPYLIIGAIIGIILSVLSLTGVLENIKLNGLENEVIKISPYLLIIIGIIISITVLIIVKKTEKEVKNLNDENIDKIEKRLNFCVLLSNILIFSTMILFGVSFYNMFDRDISLILFLITLVIYFLSLYVATSTNARIVEIAKKIDPLKKGDVYDKNFSKQWFESCDELEKKLIYEVGYKTFEFMNIVLISLLVLFILLGMVFKIGIFPIVLVGVLSFVQNMAYNYYATKLDNKHLD